MSISDKFTRLGNTTGGTGDPVGKVTDSLTKAKNAPANQLDRVKEDTANRRGRPDKPKSGRESAVPGPTKVTKSLKITKEEIDEDAR